MFGRRFLLGGDLIFQGLVTIKLGSWYGLGMLWSGWLGIYVYGCNLVKRYLCNVIITCLILADWRYWTVIRVSLWSRYGLIGWGCIYACKKLFSDWLLEVSNCKCYNMVDLHLVDIRWKYHKSFNLLIFESNFEVLWTWEYNATFLHKVI